MSIPTKQQAVVLPAAHAPFEVGTVDVPKPGPGEVLVKVHAVGLNPLDWKVQKYDIYVTYPAILGCDAAGEIVALGEGVTTFSVGDRVLFEGNYTETAANFQQYTISFEPTTAKIPSNVSYEEAASIPLALATSALGLYAPKPIGLGLEPCWEPAGKGKYADQPFLVIGGSTSVGQLAIQLARLSGFSPIITTASLKHAEFLKTLGATHIIDRHDPLPRLSSSIAKISPKPISVAYTLLHLDGEQQIAYDALGPNGQMVIVAPKEIHEEAESGKEVVRVFGSVHAPQHKTTRIPASLFAHLTGLLESGEIKPNRVRVMPHGIQGIIVGLQELEKGVSGVKLIAQPNK